MGDMNLWCLGLKFAGTRNLTLDELNRFKSEVKRIELRSKRQLWLFSMVAVVGAAATVQYVLSLRGEREFDASLMFFSVIAIGMEIGRAHV